MGNKNLTLKRILKKHRENPDDEELNKMIENEEIDKEKFDKIINKGSFTEPFDKKKKT